jgi:short-subunit dehydrogenase
VEGFSESLQYELDQFGIAMRVIEPGVIVTDFYGRSADRVDSSGLAEYADYVANVDRVTMASASKAGPMEPVVRAVIDAAQGAGPFRRAVGWPSYIVKLRRWLPEKMYLSAVRREYRR